MQWGVVAFGILCAFPVVWFRIKDTVTVEEDLKFSDETIDDVTVAGNPKRVDNEV